MEYNLADKERERYNRNILLDEIGEKGQQKLKEARVLIVGAGGLGSSVAYYLAATGVGTLGIIDYDLIELSNLQRQILHSTTDIGQAKVDSAKETLKSLNPEIDIVTYEQQLGKNNVKELIKKYDLVINCVDNFSTRYLINDACVLTSTPLIEGGVLGLEGQITFVLPGEGPCYRCIFPAAPEKDDLPAGQSEGILGAIAGTIGTLQATETVKYLVGAGELLIGRLLIYDALKTSFRKVEIEKNPECSACGTD